MGTKCVLKHQILQMFSLKLNKIIMSDLCKLWVAVARHNFRWVKI